MPEARLEKTRAAYRPSPVSSVDWQAGAGSYIPCPNNCGRLVPQPDPDVYVDVAPCARCRNIAAQKQTRQYLAHAMARFEECDPRRTSPEKALDNEK